MGLTLAKCVFPFSRFSENKEVVQVKFHDNGTVSYKQERRWYFDSEYSAGSLKDNVTTLNAVVVVGEEDKEIEEEIGEFLFDGYENKLLNMAKKMPMLKIPYDKFGWFYTRNGSDQFDGHFNIDTGQNGIHNIGKVYQWQYTNTTSFYEGTCAMVNGTSGTLFPPVRSKQDRVTMYSPDLCRSISFDYSRVESVEGVPGYRFVGSEYIVLRSISFDYSRVESVEGVPGYRFVGSEYIVDNGTLDPSNECFCNGECVPSGVINVTSCRFGAPAFVSYPHFYKADPYFASLVTGMKPERDKHEFYLTLEPSTGIPLDVGARFQINLLLQPIESIIFLKINKKQVPNDSGLTVAGNLFEREFGILTLGVIFMTVGALLTLTNIEVTSLPSFFQLILQKELALSPWSRSFKIWRSNPVPIYLDFYFFNWTNPEDIRNNETKPNFVEMGPYRFQAWTINGPGSRLPEHFISMSTNKFGILTLGVIFMTVGALLTLTNIEVTSLPSFFQLILQKTPLITLKGHKEAISAVQWTAVDEIITSSWDHTLKIWDAELGGMKSEIVGNKSFFDVHYSPLSKLVITASADKQIRLYDPKVKEGAIVKSTFSSHKEWVQSVRWSPIDPQLFVSASFDNSVKLWDLRSPKVPLFDMLGHEDKVMCVNWSDYRYIMSGGQDNSVRVFKTKHQPKSGQKSKAGKQSAGRPINHGTSTFVETGRIGVLPLVHLPYVVDTILTCVYVEMAWESNLRPSRKSIFFPMIWFSNRATMPASMSGELQLLLWVPCVSLVFCAVVFLLGVGLIIYSMLYQRELHQYAESTCDRFVSDIIRDPNKYNSSPLRQLLPKDSSTEQSYDCPYLASVNGCQLGQLKLEK
ncbi:LOW QUALITY PROTEIN: uncharacterized protein LOC103506297 [Diaphorina citri]|uniref:LOW QUALITY PROTEIN: uncharacterized protein LOC103506297 n=1 Tax=Diaphorina citri TaxID=121845 RepID=A0A3Q0IS61_DIACI|nr:LOW QUALITY PROTEIN: uncharacterized protein LOC103506297 [Diaphorina citri]